MNLSDSAYYINRELSQLEFNRRVLAQASDPAVPLLERFRFLCICSSNLDEFFEVRVAGLKHQIAFNSYQIKADSLSPQEVLKRIRVLAHEIVAEQYRVFSETLLPALAEAGIYFLRREQWNDKQGEWLRQYFKKEILPIISPIGLDNAHPFPRLINKNLNFIVSLEGKDAFGRDSGLAIVHLPRILPRLIPLPESICDEGKHFVFLSSIVHAHAAELFPGMVINGCYQFRVTRNSDLLIDEEDVDDLASAVKSELVSRRFGHAVRLEVSEECDEELVKFILQKHKLTEEDTYRTKGPVNLNRFVKLLEHIDVPELRYPALLPASPKSLKNKKNLFDAIREEDILLHHPFESFNVVVDFVRQATLDPSVIAIKQTLYRTVAESVMVQALIDAARAGKEVTAVIELRARFDEAANIELANRLQEAGALVVYGVVGYKTHAKMTLVVRREKGKLRRYVHLGTGNYHENTACLYTDYGLLTYNKAITIDIQSLFQQLTGMGQTTKMKCVLQAPFTLQKFILARLDNERKQAEKGEDARVIIKVNALTDAKLIQALYRASQAGVKIDLIVRGACCLRPGIPGVSDNIHVRSIIDRFLEHSRVYYFYCNGDEKLFCSSADWMERNLYHRVEVCFPIFDKKMITHIKQDLKAYLNDNCQSWILQKDGSYQRSKPGKAVPRPAQQLLLKHLGR